MKKNKLLSIAAFILCFAIVSTAQALPVHIGFSVDLYAKFDYATQSYGPSFVPYTTSVLVNFDTDVTRIATYPNDTIIYFGSNTANSPLTETLPLGPSGSMISPTEVQKPTILSDYDYGPGRDGSYLSILQNQYERIGDVSWSYHFGLRSSPQVPPLDNPLTFTSQDLLNYLFTLESNQTEFTFSEHTDVFDNATREYLGGVGYSGRAYIANITPVPEPSSFFLLSIGLAFLIAIGFVRKWFNNHLSRLLILATGADH